MIAAELDLVVAAIATPAPGVKLFRLAAREGALPPIAAGSHLRLLLDVDGRRLANAYSPMPGAAGTWTIAVKLDPNGRGGSRFLHERVTVGDRLAATAPVAAFPLIRSARRHLFVAGGIGITPFVSLAEEAARLGLDFELRWAVSDPADAPFLADLAARHGDRVRLHVSRAGDRLDLPALLSGEPAGARLYVCGSDRLVEATLAAARAVDWPESRIHREVFASPAGGEPFTVRLARSGREIRVGAEESLLDALEAAGVAIEAMCRGGACGACETAVAACDGALHHADHWLDPETRAAGTRIMPCVSRFSGRLLTLDL